MQCKHLLHPLRSEATAFISVNERGIQLPQLPKAAETKPQAPTTWNLQDRRRFHAKAFYIGKGHPPLTSKRWRFEDSSLRVGNRWAFLGGVASNNGHDAAVVLPSFPYYLKKHDSGRFAKSCAKHLGKLRFQNSAAGSLHNRRRSLLFPLKEWILGGPSRGCSTCIGAVFAVSFVLVKTLSSGVDYASVCCPTLLHMGNVLVQMSLQTATGAHFVYSMVTVASSPPHRSCCGMCWCRYAFEQLPVRSSSTA